MNDVYYDGTKLLSLTDINGLKPELYMCCGNRSSGKTTFFNRLAINGIKKGSIRKFMLLYRFTYELDSICEKFFTDIQGLFFPNDEMYEKKRCKGLYVELFLNKNSVGYAVCLNNADALKKFSHVFSTVDLVIFDEFQSETNHYCANEINKFLSIQKTVARGQGEQSRYVRFVLLSNCVDILNPYFTKLKISTRINAETKFLRGNGFVLEQNTNLSAMQAQQNSGISKAFSDSQYVSYSSQAIYLFDNKAFIEKLSGANRYIVTIKYNNKEYAIREYVEQGLIYCDDKVDTSYKFKIAVTITEHDINYVMLKRNDYLIKELRFYFDKGCFRFKNYECKEALLSLITY